ncbi:MAG: DNA recombination protein RmuC [Kiritimatiellae bacterium]|nr:DNA recombination protein RmuC [Kiritimatiellia bacterium]
MAIATALVAIVLLALAGAAAYFAARLTRKAYEGQVATLKEQLGDAMVAAQTEREWVRNLEEGRIRAEEEVKAIEAANRERDLRYKHEQDLAYARIKELSEKILGENARRLKEEGNENISRLLKPLQEEIGKFRQRIDEVNTEDARRSGQLDERIRKLVEDTNQISQEASDLASAIRGEAQVTGEWAELQLKRVLELGGLKEETDYSYQETFASDGSLRKDKRLDFLVKMPDDRWLVIDSKATIGAYADYHGEDDPEKRETAKERIVASVKAHIDEMAAANYVKSLNLAAGRKLLSTMFMYIPFDEVYLIAMKAKVTVQANGRSEPMLLRDYARMHDIALVNGASVVPLVRLIEEMWVNYNLDKRAVKIKEAAEGLVDKFNTFANGFQELGKTLGRVNEQYNAAVRQLSVGPGNVLKRLGDLRELGVPAAAKVVSPEVMETKILNENV